MLDESEHLIKRLRELVECESPTEDRAALSLCADLLDGWFTSALGRPAQRVFTDGRQHLLWAADDPAVLLLGHYDTVWPVGTLADIPFTIDEGIARGPGVFDMKAGIVLILSAVEQLADRSRLSVLLTADEETGSVGSRTVIEEQARRSAAVLVCEPSADGGAAKIARKGVARYTITLTGRAAHAGLEPHLGVNASLEMAHQMLATAALAAPELGTTVTPTVSSSGTTVNTVPEAAVFEVDVRAWERGELDRVDAGLHALTPVLGGATVTVVGGPNRYPLEPKVATGLLAELHAAAESLGIAPPAGERSGGGSDANLTGALGVPTLCGLGAMGAHPHGRDEHVDVASLPQRAALLAELVRRLCASGLGFGSPQVRA
ncbi:glutamate carboxypeptidase [Longispora fulva]|uniref:Glutamate carboxypeptidase n=1 Tax=Longispora fulva TaxID=619741 RepID=A0A8J7GE67_9ACTN|nr:M20 family metallopeptidase [Longispora fulva]MBG6136046.1 glutamate carboxypeptidase [Longispora fulva]GIG55712.1 glutamate carboxypeptidase [Longispora fulva]